MQCHPQQSIVHQNDGHQQLSAGEDALSHLFLDHCLVLHVHLFHPGVPLPVQRQVLARVQHWAAHGLLDHCDLLDLDPCRLDRRLFVTAVLVVVAVAALVVRVCLCWHSHSCFDFVHLFAFVVLLGHFLGLTPAAGRRLWESTYFVAQK